MIMIQEEPILKTIWGPCFGHKRAIFWLFLGKVATGYTQQCKLWLWTSLGLLIKNQEKIICRIIWGPCFGHKRAIFWLLQNTSSTVKFCMGFPGHINWIQEEHIWRTMWEPLFGNKGPYFCHREERGLEDIPSNVKFGKKHPWAYWLRFRRHQFEGQYKENLLATYKKAISWPFLGKGTTGYTQQYEIWQGTCLGTLIKIQQKLIWRTSWGPYYAI